MRRAGRITIAIAATLFAAGLARDRLDALIAATDLPPLAQEVSVTVLDRDGVLLNAFTVADGRWRLPVTTGSVDPRYIDALIRAEDKRFYSHGGVDVRALARAAVQALRHGRVVSGGSTLSMQVARLVEDSGTGAWAGKLRQMRVALALERRIGKAGVLDLYLQLAPMGGNLEGVRAATLSYFGKEPARLTPEETALLIAMPQSPAARRPDVHPTTARAARNRVLHRLADAGLIDAAARDAAIAAPVPKARADFPSLAPHLAERLRREQPYATVIRTTLDARLQARATALLRAQVRAIHPGLSGAVVVIEAQSGAVRAWVGSPDPLDARRQGGNDMVLALRSPGSTLKPFIYGLAFAEGVAHPETLIEDRPTSFGGYAPGNFDGQFRGTIRVRDALAQSLNIPAVALLDALGPATLTATLARAGAPLALPGRRPAGLAVGLGGAGISLQALAGAYTAFPNLGEAVVPHVIGDDGPVELQRVLPDVAAWQVGDILSAISPPPSASGRKLAYKTGTSYGHRDFLALGFDRDHVAGIWLGRPDGGSLPGYLGADLAAPLLFEVFSELGPDPVPLHPPPPATLLVGNGDLPQPLRRFGGPRDRIEVARDAPELAFPPDGALVEIGEGADTALTLRVAQGRAPFSWLVNGRPVGRPGASREVTLHGVARGLTDVAVIDADGRSARARVDLR